MITLALVLWNVEYMAAGAIPIGEHFYFFFSFKWWYFSFLLSWECSGWNYIDVLTFLSSAHNSAGPKMDIVLEEDGQQTGFLAQNVEEYADAFLKVLRMLETERLKMAAAARKRAGRFSEQRFFEDFKAAIRPMLNHVSRWWISTVNSYSKFLTIEQRSIASGKWTLIYSHSHFMLTMACCTNTEKILDWKFSSMWHARWMNCIFWRIM